MQRLRLELVAVPNVHSQFFCSEPGWEGLVLGRKACFSREKSQFCSLKNGSYRLTYHSQAGDRSQNLTVLRMFHVLLFALIFPDLTIPLAMGSGNADSNGC